MSTLSYIYVFFFCQVKVSLQILRTEALFDPCTREVFQNGSPFLAITKAFTSRKLLCKTTGKEYNNSNTHLLN